MINPCKKQQIPSPQLNAQTLESVKIEGYIRDLICELTIKQTFANHTASNIEAVYTFPLPYGAVLTDLQVKIGDRELKGSVAPKRQAELGYEAAITEGDGAIMLERADNGICTLNVGNLMPKERAVVTYQYAYLLNWQKDTVRFMLPTTIAPRYGDPIAAGFQPHQVPVVDMWTEHRFSFKLSVEGLLASALFDSPSHRIAVQHKDNKASLHLNQNQTFMDRDFVLNMKFSGANQSVGQVCKDEIGSTYTALASFSPTIVGAEVPSICAKILVDCSGSMAGNSITQAKAGLHRILDNLRDTDTFNIICFGDHHQVYFPYCVPATRRNLTHARQIVDQIDANMGGTEMANALDFTYTIKDEGEHPISVLLITDGQVYEHQEVVARAQQSAQHVYTIGVGSAVSESFLRDLAEHTKGFCELVSPNEGMAEAIYRQFKRMSQTRITKVDIEWPNTPLWQYPQQINSVFTGDTVHIFANFNTPVVGELKLVLHLGNGETQFQYIDLVKPENTWQDLPRVAIAQRLEQLVLQDKVQAEELAVQYQLLTSYTNYLILDIKQADQKAEDLPNLVQVPQMLAAGWGGTGKIQYNRAQQSMSDLDITHFESLMMSPSRKLCAASIMPDMDYLDLSPVFDESIIPNASYSIPKLSGAVPGIADNTDKYQAIIQLIIEAEDDWFNVFNEYLLPQISEELTKHYYQVIADLRWTESQVAVAMIMSICYQLNIYQSNTCIANAYLEIALESGLVTGFSDLVKDELL